MNPADLLRRVSRRGRTGLRDPYEGLPTDELDEPVLPRWFVLLALATVPLAIVLFLVAFFGGGSGETPVPERRPPPGGGLTSEVGDFVVGDRSPVDHDPACEEVAGYRVAGTDLDRTLLGGGLDVLCEAPQAVRDEVAGYGDERPVVRFAAFEATGVDVTGAEGVVYVNARFSQTDSDAIGPLVAYQAVVARGEPVAASTVLDAREVELAACDAVLAEPTRPCEDAAALLDLEDPEGALEAAGFR